MELVIDNREHKLIQQLRQRGCQFSVEALDLGDILFRETGGGECILIIERKTLPDLRASICDGRAREQKTRLLYSGIAKERIMYLIEGNMNFVGDSGIPATTLLGSLINTQLRDGLKVYKTVDLQETVKFILKLYSKLADDRSHYFCDQGEITSAKYVSTLKTRKKANMTQEVWFIAQLSLIPQVTELIASEIAKVYPSVLSLVQAYTSGDATEPGELLADITYPLSSGKTRRIGSKISQRIYSFLSPPVKPEPEPEGKVSV
jgi:ERCC4-type nuclease